MQSEQARRNGWLIAAAVGLLIACFAMSYAYVSDWQGDNDGANHAVGRDFVNLWTASQLIEADRPLDVFDQDAFAAEQRSHFGDDFPFHFWSYPPHALFLTQGLADLPYRAAFAVWSLSGLVVLYLAARKFWGRTAEIWFLLLAPSSFVNLFLGQNGFLTTALALAGFALLPRQAIMAGLIFGLLTFKPHLGIMIPVALLAMRQWKAIIAAVVSASLVIVASVLLYGADVWGQFLQSTLPYQLRYMAEGEGPFQWMMSSWFMAGRIVGLPLWAGQAIQVIVLIVAVFLVYRVFRGGGDWHLKVGLLVTATLVASPQGFSYDLGLISAAVIILSMMAMRDGWRTGELPVVALCWPLPLMMMPLAAIGIPIAPPLLAGLLFCLYRRWRMDGEPVGDVAQSGVPQGNGQ